MMLDRGNRFRYKGLAMATATNANDAAGERGRLAVVLATVAINVVAVSLLPFVPWSDWRTGAALNFIDNFLLIGLYSSGGIDCLHGSYSSVSSQGLWSLRRMRGWLMARARSITRSAEDR